MNILVWAIMIAISLYTMGFSRVLWKDKNKLGSIAVFMLGICTIIAPFLSVLSW